MDWSKVQKEHVDAAIQKFIDEKPEHPEPRSYYLLYNGEKLPSKYIRGLAYSIATGEPINLAGFNGGVETVNFFKKYGYTVESVNVEGQKRKYPVNDAVWIATALLAYEAYITIPNACRKDMYFKQSAIVHKAQEIADGNVDAARVSWWVNADNEKSTQNYLREDLEEDNSTRRLSKMDEYEEKTYPSGLDMTDILSVGEEEITMGDLFSFVKENYPAVLEVKQVSKINYLGILEYLKNNRELPYANPENPGLTEEQKKEYLAVKKNGQDIVAELKKIYELCKRKYGLTKCEKVSWDDGSHQKTRKYLWVPMKYGDKSDRHESISVFVEMITKDKPVFRVSLELRNDRTKAEDVKKYHTHLDLPVNTDAGLVYVSGSNELGRPDKLTESQDVIKQKVENKEYDKVQICKYISADDYPTNEEIEAGILGAVEALLPYYEHVVGAASQKRDELMEALKEMDLENIDLKYNKGEDETVNTSGFDKNMILYGPPGTGKTYSTAKYAVSICDGDKAPDLSNYPAVMKRYRELMDEHRIAFVTFHQSYGYEEFIEGIKPVMDKTGSQSADAEGEKNNEIKYDVIDGVFKRFCDRARTSTVITKSQEGLISDSACVWKATVRSEVRQDCFDNNRVRIDWGFDSDGAAGFVEDIQKGDIIVTTDGSRTVINGIAVVATDEAEELNVEGDSTSRQVVWLAKDINENIKTLNKNKILHRKTVARVPNMAAADIISLAKKLNPQDDVLSQTTIEENKKPYVFIIDEINRGNISKIFGELITLIEDTKREGLDECIPAILPYSGDEFTVPDNVYLLGTMNTADRSIALMDTALRRRFKFMEMLPDHKLLKGITIEDAGESLDVEKMLKIINERITYLYDREHTIGHAIFMKLTKEGENTLNNLASIFAKSVIPLLQEYFYEDYEKIRLVLGDNAKKDAATQFVIAEDVPDDTFEGDVSDEIDIPEKSYRIEYDNFTNIMAYKGISKKL